MRSTTIASEDGAARSFVLVFDAGDRFEDALLSWARERGISGGHFTGLGAFEHADLAYFDWESRSYRDLPVDEQVEVSSLVGNVAQKEGGERVVHAHCVLGRRDGSALAGHLMDATVRPTLELLFRESNTPLHRLPDQDSGLDLLRP